MMVLQVVAVQADAAVGEMAEVAEVVVDVVVDAADVVAN
jgi:hypothetical protein